MIVKAVKESERGELVTLTLFGEAEEKLTVMKDTYESVGALLPGDTVTEERYDILAYGDEYYRAVKKALSLLSFSDNSKIALLKKLCDGGFSKNAASDAIDYMVFLGYIDEKKSLARLVLREATSNLSGPRKICAKLAAKGYKTSDITVTIRELSELGELNFEECFNRLAGKKLSSDATSEDIKKLKFKYGYI